MIDLAQEKKYETITIQDITTRSDIGYRTFFNHFVDKEALLRTMLEGLIEELNGLFQSASVTDESKLRAWKDLENAHVLFEHAQANEGLYRLLLESDAALLNQTIDMFSEKCK